MKITTSSSQTPENSSDRTGGWGQRCPRLAALFRPIFLLFLLLSTLVRALGEGHKPEYQAKGVSTGCPEYMVMLTASSTFQLLDLNTRTWNAKGKHLAIFIII